MPETSKVVLRRATDSDLETRVRECLERLDWESLVPKNSVVVIKPNLSTAVPDKVAASNTSVAVIEAVCRVLQQRTRRITVGESGHMRQNPWQAYDASGYREMAVRLGVELVNFSESPTTPTMLDCGIELRMPKALLEADVYINLPTLKTHALTYFTGALKNQWGCVPDYRDRLRRHRSIERLLCSIQKLLAPKLILMDAIVGMEGRGPVNGQPRTLNAVLASRDPVALDATAMRLVSLDPTKAGHVKLAAKLGLGRFDAAGIEVDGDWASLKTQFAPPPRDFANSAMFYLTQYPWFVKYVLGNDRVYFPIRDAVTFFRKLGVVAK